MHRETVKIKLQALRSNVNAALLNPRHQYYDPKDYLDLFQRYGSVRDSLRTDLSDLFDDLPAWEVEVSHTTDNDGRGYIKRRDVEKLLRDIDYSLRILSAADKPQSLDVDLTREGVFFAGQYFDALTRIAGILGAATRSVVVIDGYVDEKVLSLFTEKVRAVEVSILTKGVSPALRTAAQAFNKQYGGLTVRTSSAFHDRFVIVDHREFYHLGASIKDAGHRGFMFSRIEEPTVIDALRNEWLKEWQAANVVVIP